MTTHAHKRSLLAVLLTAPFLAQADVTIANVATPSIHSDLRASGAALELVVGGYLIAFAVLLITGARLGETYGYRRVFIVGLTAFGLASTACGLAPDPMMLVLARVIQGTAAALMFPQALTGIQLNFSGSDRTRAIGLYAIALSSGAATGQILGGTLVSANLAGTHWRAVFLVNVPVVAVAVLAALRHLPPDGHRPSRRVDLGGIAAMSASLLLVVLPLVVGRTEGWPAWTWMSLVASGPAFALFLIAERQVEARGGTPLINVRLVARPTVALGLVTMLMATGSYYGLLFTLAQYLQHGLGHSAVFSGLTLVPFVAAFGLAGQVVRRLPPAAVRIAPVAGCLLLGCSYGAISLALFGGEGKEGLLVALLGTAGFGLGLQYSSLVGYLTNAVATVHAPDISGLVTTTAQIGGAIAVAGFGTLYLGVAHAGSVHAVHAFAVVTAGFAGVALAASATARLATRPGSARRSGALTEALGAGAR